MVFYIYQDSKLKVELLIIFRNITFNILIDVHELFKGAYPITRVELNNFKNILHLHCDIQITLK